MDKPPARDLCRQIQLTGEVAAGKEWSVAIGEGWVFRVVPIAPSGKGYTGWDLAVDRIDGKDRLAGYPDALLLATPPYGSPNEREIGTTFGLRAQDAIAWGPRRFHFFTSTVDLQRARDLFRQITADKAIAQPGTKSDGPPGQQLLAMLSGGAKLGTGEFRVLDARLTSGVADPQPFARQWAAYPSVTVQSSQQPGPFPSALGELQWIRFASTLWLPHGWRTPEGIRSTETKCSE